MYEIKDSGKRHSFATGSVRDTQDGKPFPDLISPFMLYRLAMHYANGAKKYNERNWELGQPSSQYLRSCLRHIIAYMIGERDEDHIAAAIWNLSGIIHNEALVERGIYDGTIIDNPDYSNESSFIRTVAEKCLKENAKDSDEA